MTETFFEGLIWGQTHRFSSDCLDEVCSEVKVADQLCSEVKVATINPQSQRAVILHFMDITKRRIKYADSYTEEAKNQNCHLIYFTMRDKKINDIMNPWLVFLDKLSLALFPF